MILLKLTTSMLRIFALTSRNFTDRYCNHINLIDHLRFHGGQFDVEDEPALKQTVVYSYKEHNSTFISPMFVIRRDLL